MGDVIYYSNGTIDWNSNGWPEPNPGADTDMDGYTTDTMPDDIFDQWLSECDDLDCWGADD